MRPPPTGPRGRAAAGSVRDHRPPSVGAGCPRNGKIQRPEREGLAWLPLPRLLHWYGPRRPRLRGRVAGSGTGCHVAAAGQLPPHLRLARHLPSGGRRVRGEDAAGLGPRGGAEGRGEPAPSSGACGWGVRHRPSRRRGGPVLSGERRPPARAGLAAGPGTCPGAAPGCSTPR